MKQVLAAITIWIGLTAAGQAQVKLEGEFTAQRDCPAVLSIKKNSNPDHAVAKQGQRYQLLGKNKDQATHYWIEVPDAKPVQRWVAIACGSIDGTNSAGKLAQAVPVAPNTPVNAEFYVLALSWEPSFCEAMAGKAECKFATADAYDATHLSLHGLWPQPRNNVFCNVDKATAALDDNHRWEQLPEPQLSPATRAALEQVMPGTKSMLERHEWIKHGTCFPAANADTYFKHAARLTETVNASAVQTFIATNVGKTIQTADLLQAFDDAFGKGAGQRVRVACKDDGGRQLISELTIGLKGDIASGAPLEKLILASKSTDPGCPSGIIDPAGRQ